MVKIISRLALIIIGALLIWRGAAQMVTDFRAISELFKAGISEAFQKFSTDPDARNLAISFLKDCLWMLIAATSILAGVFSKSGFWMSFFALIALAFIFFDIYNKIQAGLFQKNFLETLLGVLADFALQIGYIVFSIVLKFEIKKEEAQEEANAV